MADRHWVGGTATWDTTAGTKWALTAGGAGGQAVPTGADDVYFSSGSGVVTTTGTAAANCKSLTVTSGFTGTIVGGGTITIRDGNVSIVPLATTNVLITMLPTGPGPYTFDVSNNTIRSLTIQSNGATSNITLTSNLTCANSVDIANVVFSTAGYAITIASVSPPAGGSKFGAATRPTTIDLSNSVVTFTGRLDLAANLTLISNGAVLKHTNALVPSVMINQSGGIGSLNIHSEASMANIAIQVDTNSSIDVVSPTPTVRITLDSVALLGNNSLLYVSSMNLAINTITSGATGGGYSFLVANGTMNSNTTKNRATIIKESGTMDISNIIIRGIDFTGGATFTATGIDAGNNSGISIMYPPTNTVNIPPVRK